MFAYRLNYWECIIDPLDGDIPGSCGLPMILLDMDVPSSLILGLNNFDLSMVY